MPMVLKNRLVREAAKMFLFVAIFAKNLALLVKNI